MPSITTYLAYMITSSYSLGQTLFLVDDEETEACIANGHPSTYLAKCLALKSLVFAIQKGSYLSHSLSCTSFGHGMGWGIYHIGEGRHLQNWRAEKASISPLPVFPMETILGPGALLTSSTDLHSSGAALPF